MDSEQVGMILRLSSANACGSCTLDEFVTDTWQHRAGHGDDADDFAWMPFDPATGQWLDGGVSGEEI